MCRSPSCRAIGGQGQRLAARILAARSSGDDAIAALRSRLGNAAFEDAWDYGRSLGGKRAVEYALNNGQTSTADRGPSKPEEA